LVKIYAIAQNFYQYPEVKFTAQVSSGTYIRSLVEDIGEKLGTGAYMTALRRTKVGTFTVDDAVLMQNLSYKVIAANLQF
jgi:tRNA pseudouridine55 synthase